MNSNNTPLFTSSFFILLLLFNFLVLMMTMTIDTSEALNNNNFYGSCSGECVSLPSLLQFINSGGDDEINESLFFCSETIQEYLTLNESIRICISTNITLISNSTNTTNSSINSDDLFSPAAPSLNFTTLDYFKASDEQAMESFKSEFYHRGLFQHEQCYSAARRYICQHFFPLCDVSSDESNQIYNLCRSSCDNYYSSCNSRELIDFRCLATSNGINRVYKGSWKVFGEADSVMCTGGGATARSHYISIIMALLVYLFFLMP